MADLIGVDAESLERSLTSRSIKMRGEVVTTNLTLQQAEVCVCVCVCVPARMCA